MHGYETDSVIKLETNLDDCPAEIIGSVMERLFAAGALDVWFTPIQMKKHRPGVMLSALCEEEKLPALADLVFRETTAFGLRTEKVVRLKLARKFETIETPYGQVRVKIGLKGEHVVQVAPEFESCRAAAERAGVAIRDVYTAVLSNRARATEPYQSRGATGAGHDDRNPFASPTAPGAQSGNSPGDVLQTPG